MSSSNTNLLNAAVGTAANPRAGQKVSFNDKHGRRFVGVVLQSYAHQNSRWVKLGYADDSFEHADWLYVCRYYRGALAPPHANLSPTSPAP